MHEMSKMSKMSIAAFEMDHTVQQRNYVALSNDLLTSFSPIRETESQLVPSQVANQPENVVDRLVQTNANAVMYAVGRKGSALSRKRGCVFANAAPALYNQAALQKGFSLYLKEQNGSNAALCKSSESDDSHVAQRKAIHAEQRYMEQIAYSELHGRLKDLWQIVAKKKATKLLPVEMDVLFSSIAKVTGENSFSGKERKSSAVFKRTFTKNAYLTCIVDVVPRL